MPRSRVAGALCILLLAWVDQASATPAPIRVLFVGNSYTYFYDLPALVAAFAAVSGDLPIEVESTVGPGRTLQDQWNLLSRSDTLRRGWDFVVFQGNSREPIERFRRFERNALRLVDAAIAAGAKPVLFATWARRDAPAPRDAVERAYLKVAAQRPGVRVARVGSAFERAKSALGTTSSLYLDDGSHPSPTGAYLAALVLFSTLTERPPIGLPTRVELPPPPIGPQLVVEVSSEDAAVLQRTAAGSGADRE